MSRFSRKQWLALLGVIALAILGGAIWSLYADAAPPDDADMVVELKYGPKQTNGLYDLVSVAEALMNMKLSTEFTMALLQFKHGNGKREEAAGKLREITRQIKPQLDKVDGILASGHFTEPGFNNPNPAATNTKVVDAIADYLADRAVWHSFQNKPEEAWADIIRGLKVGQALLEGNMTVTGYRSGLMTVGSALFEARDYLPGLAPDAATTRRRTDELKAFEPTPEQFIAAFRRDYTEAMNLLPWLGKLARKQYSILGPVALHPNRTRAKVLRLYRETIDELDTPTADLSLPYADELQQASPGLANWLGQMIAREGVSTSYSTLYMYNETRAEFAVVRLALALTGYANEHDGNLPGKLKKLVPDYIDAIPVNPITGGEIQYHPGFREVWVTEPPYIDPDPAFKPIFEPEPTDFKIEIPDTRR